jgi:signal transduction histidine kinase
VSFFCRIRSARWSVQTKVLAVVLAFLVALPALTVWIVTDSLKNDVLLESRQSLKSAEAVFNRLLDARAENLFSRYHSFAGEARFRVTAAIKDPKTMQRLLRDVLADSPGEHEVFVFSTRDEGYLAGVHRENAKEPAVFFKATKAATDAALNGEMTASSVSISGEIYTVVAVPVTNDDGAILGVLTVGVRLGREALRQLQVPQTEVILLFNVQVVATSFVPEELGEGIVGQIGEQGILLKEEAHDRVFSVKGGNKHFMGIIGAYGGRRVHAEFRYVLLWSYEDRLQSMSETRLKLLGLSVVGIVLSALGVSWFVRRVTIPLRELRDGAEAVGRGDFSRRIKFFSNDEVGEVAREFNRMTTNLQASRVELERAMQTVKLTQEQLIQREKLSAVGMFVAGVAHELNNPLTAVVGLSELLKSLPAGASPREYHDRIAKSAMRCHKIVHSLLSFSRQQPAERKLIQAHDVVGEVLDVMAYELRTNGIKVICEFTEVLAPIVADSHQLQQVFVNILSNARQAMEPAGRGGQITIRTWQSESTVCLEVADNGPGIRPENLARIFDPFFTTKPVGRGTGLGLSLCYGIIQEHGGRILAQSEFGKGAVFRIELPAAPKVEEAANSTESDGGITELHASRRYDILIVDDEPWIRDLAGDILRRDGHAVVLASGGMQALSKIAKQKFDVIVSDWKMPEMNGIQLYEHLQATDPAVARRMMLMTGDLVNHAIQDFLNQNGITCLSKPFVIGEFRSAVERLARRGPGSAV